MSLNNIGVDILKRNHQATYYLGVKIPPPPKQLHINLVRKRWFLDRGTFSAMHNNNETHLWTLVKTSFLACEKLFFGGGGQMPIPNPRRYLPEERMSVVYYTLQNLRVVGVELGKFPPFSNGKVNRNVVFGIPEIVVGSVFREDPILTCLPFESLVFVSVQKQGFSSSNSVKKLDLFMYHPLSRRLLFNFFARISS